MYEKSTENVPGSFSFLKNHLSKGFCESLHVDFDIFS